MRGQSKQGAREGRKKATAALAVFSSVREVTRPIDFLLFPSIEGRWENLNITWWKPELRPSGVNLLMEGKLGAPSLAPRSSFNSETVEHAWVASESAHGGFYFMLFSAEQA